MVDSLNVEKRVTMSKADFQDMGKTSLGERLEMGKSVKMCVTHTYPGSIYHLHAKLPAPVILCMGTFSGHCYGQKYHESYTHAQGALNQCWMMDKISNFLALLVPKISLGGPVGHGDECAIDGTSFIGFLPSTP